MCVRAGEGRRGALAFDGLRGGNYVCKFVLGWVEVHWLYRGCGCDIGGWAPRGE